MADLSKMNPEDVWNDDLQDSFEAVWGDVASSPMDIDPDTAQEHLRNIGLQGARKQGRGAAGALQGFINALQGPTIGWGADIGSQIVGMVRGLPQEQRNQLAAAAKAAAAEQREKNPILSALTQAAASAPVFAALPTVSGRSALTALPAAAGVGTLTGAIQSAGEAQDDRAGAALEGGVLGAMFSPIPAVGQSVVRGIKNIASKGGQREAAFAEIVKAFTRDNPPKPKGLPAEQIRARQLSALGSEGRLVDIGGAEARKTLDVLTVLPGEAAEKVQSVIKGRHQARYDAIRSSLDKQLGTGGKDYLTHIDATTARRAAESRPLYDIIDNSAVTVDDELAKALQMTRDSHASAEKMARLGLRMDVDLSALKQGDQIPLSVLENVYRSLRDSSRSAAVSGQGNLAHEFGSAAKHFSDVIDKHAPQVDGKSVLRQARAAYAEPSRAIELAEIGRKAMKEDVLELRTIMRGMEKSELEPFRIGVAQGIKELAGTEAGQTKLLNAWKNPATRERLKLALGDAYPDFYSTIRAQQKMKTLQSVGAGSQTAQRLQSIEDLGSPLDIAIDAKTSGAASVAVPLMKRVAGRVAMPEGTRNAMADILLSRGREAQQNNLLLEAALQKMKRSETLRTTTGGASGSAAGRSREERK